MCIAGERVAAIGPGLLVLLCAERGDTTTGAQRMIERLLAYRVFNDEQGKMNRSLHDIGGGLLLVPQFTLAADTTRGNRPSFTPAAPPEEGRALFEVALAHARSLHPHVAAGRFGADMQVKLINDGPVTLSLRVDPSSTKGT